MSLPATACSGDRPDAGGSLQGADIGRCCL